MKPTGLPPMPTTPREWRLWTHAAVERVRREAATTALSGEQQRGRVEGAQRLADLLISCLQPETGADSLGTKEA